MGDEDDPDVAYLPDLDAFLYIANTDNSNGSTGTLGNRIVGSIINPASDAQGRLVVRAEQVLGDGRPAGRAEGHPASIQNPFNGRLITAYDAGNGTAAGELSYYNLGTAPAYAFTEAQPEVPYLAGTNSRFCQPARRNSTASRSRNGLHTRGSGQRQGSFRSDRRRPQPRDAPPTRA